MDKHHKDNLPEVLADESKRKQRGRRTAAAQGAPRGALQPAPATAAAAAAHETSTPPQAGSRRRRQHLFRTLGFGNGVELTTGKPQSQIQVDRTNEHHRQPQLAPRRRPERPTTAGIDGGGIAGHGVESEEEGIRSREREEAEWAGWAKTLRGSHLTLPYWATLAQ